MESEVAPLQRVLHRRALVGTHVQAELAQRLDVAVDAFALGRDALCLQPLEDLRHREPLHGIGLLLEHPHEIQQLELLTVDGHGSSSQQVRLQSLRASINYLSLLWYRQSP